MWQLDSCGYTLVGGTVVAIIQPEDDCSRLNLGDRAAPSENGADVWATFEQAAGKHGLPTMVLTDNGSALNGHRLGFTTDFEARLFALGVKAISSTPNHPQTCGKNERGHQTLARWLRKQPQATTLDELQVLLDRYRVFYNNRRHQALGGLTPNSGGTWATRPAPTAPRCRHHR